MEKKIQLANKYLKGWVMALSSMIWVPLYAVYKVIANKESFRDVCILFSKGLLIRN